jgi:Uma2 family endonuclease
MSNTAPKWMTPAEFLLWEETQDWRHELVNGAPVIRAETSNRHDVIVVNVIAELRNRLRGHICRPATADTAVVVPSGNVRRPDALVDCSGKLEGTRAHEPTVIVEVLSPSSRSIDFTAKFRDYTALETLQTYLIVDQDSPDVVVYTRGPAGRWEVAVISGIDSSVDLPAIGTDLPLAEIYDRMTFEPVTSTG